MLAQTDFIATTPVAIYGSFEKLFHPDIIFIDEAPHARELTSLIPIAFYEPIAWIFTGDVKQTKPFVNNITQKEASEKGLKYNPYSPFLQISTMVRADSAGAINSRLRINNRAYGNLQRLPSQLFYQSGMVSGYSSRQRYPKSVAHLRKHLEEMTKTEELKENRVVFTLKNSCEKKHQSSFWNPHNQKWVLDQVKKLLQDEKFMGTTDPATKGTIMIQAPYSKSVREYAAEVKLWPEEFQNRVEVLTVDKAQGNQADVVFLDMVRTSAAGFMNDAKRLNVAITRARQAEIIVMHKQGTMRKSRAGFVRTEFTARIWEDAIASGSLFSDE